MTDAIEAHLQAARLAEDEGRTTDARNGYARAAALSRESARPLLRAHALRHLSDIDRDTGQPGEALAHAEQAAALYRANGEAQPLDLANALRLKALALDVLRRRDQATVVWTEARDLYEAAGAAAGVAECEARLAAISSPAAG
ncbi:hypothetical protein [Brevundimonas lenta]|uniref:Tetratricopeptide (TPR) repeat protein n=1 Tax=Brevundimonas lenta TaxID=424796 RepID=A0A7W6JF66_9CAUL|nr:hypothetical protein [Brevundimonas lenta]MBB4083023.1 tetratricopeptide (TPR) repeat protein [Brevundimonas lenta]